MVCLKGEIVITIRPYDTLYLLRSETHLNKVCTVLSDLTIMHMLRLFHLMKPACDAHERDVI